MPSRLISCSRHPTDGNNGNAKPFDSYELIYHLRIAIQTASTHSHSHTNSYMWKFRYCSHNYVYLHDRRAVAMDPATASQPDKGTTTSESSTFKRFRRTKSVPNVGQRRFRAMSMEHELPAPPPLLPPSKYYNTSYEHRKLFEHSHLMRINGIVATTESTTTQTVHTAIDELHKFLHS